MKILFIIIILLFVVFVALGGNGFDYGTGIKTVIDTLVSPYKPLMVKKPAPSVKPLPPADWKSTTIPSYGLNLKIPLDWNVDGEHVKSPFSVHVITVSSNSGLLVAGIYNNELFKKAYNRKKGDYFKAKNLDEEVTLTNIESGEILTGQPYVVVNSQFENIQTQAQISQIKALILKDNSLLIFTLSKQSVEGIEFLRKIMSLASLN